MNRLKFHPQLAVRMPLLPFKSSYSIKEMEELLLDPRVTEAIYIASPDLYDQYLEYKGDKVSEEKKINKMWVSLHNYFTRMSTRATPFGLFAGMSMGSWTDEEMNLTVSAQRNIHARFDMDFVTDLIEKLEQIPLVRKKQRYSLNPSIYKIGDVLSYIEYEYVDNRRIYKVSEVACDDFIDALIEVASEEILYENICEKILSVDDSLELEEVEEYIDELIAGQLLFSEIRPSLTGVGPWENMLRVLKDTQADAHEELKLLDEIYALDEVITSMEELSGQGPEAFRKVVNQGRLISPDVKPNHLVQVDSFLDQSKFYIRSKVQKQLDDVFGVLQQFAEPTENFHLKVFRHEFLKRYGAVRKPLLEVLDPNQGIGYPYEEQNSSFAPFLVTMKTWDNAQRGPMPTGQPQSIQWGKKQEFLMNLVLDAQRNESIEVNIADRHFPWEVRVMGPMADSFHFLFSIFGQDDTSDEYKLELTSVGGGSSTNLVARFGSTHSPTKEVLQELAKLEEDKHPNAAVAEIVHLSQDRLGNVVLRPDMRTYEIPFFSKPGVPGDQQIPLSDLMIEVPEGANEVILWSKKLNRRVFTKLSNAHNYSKSDQPPYRFLCELQTQNVQMVVNFNWGSIGQMFKFFPRVAYKNVVLCRATWNMQFADYKELIKDVSNTETWDRWREKWNIPEIFLYIEQDNELLIDTRNEWARQSLVSRLKKKSSARLSEVLMDEASVPSRDNQGNPFANQFVAFVEEQNAPKKNNFLAKRKTQDVGEISVPTSFVVGSEWLYYKLYCSPTQADMILKECIFPLVETLTNQKFIDKWFFIRYYDPDFHLRVRFHVSDLANLGQVMPITEGHLKPLMTRHHIKSVLMDTYEREVERYGGDLIVDAETLFCGDSFHILKIVQYIFLDRNEEFRWKFALWTMDRYLDLLGEGSMEEKLAFTEKNCEYFGREFGMNKNLKVQFDSRYRELSKEIQLVISGKQDSAIFSFEEVKSRISAEVLNILQSPPDPNEVHPHSLMSSFIHMSMNRLWQVSGRFHEFCMYYLLNKYYKSSVARLKYNKVS